MAVVAGLIASFMMGRQAAVEGFSLGVLVIGANMVILKMTIGLLDGAPQAKPEPKWGAFVTVLLFLMKLPVFVYASFLVHEMPYPASAWFLIGLGLVYSATIGWAQCKT